MQTLPYPRVENQRGALVQFPAAAWVSSLKKVWPLLLRSKSTRGAFYPDRVASIFALGRTECGSWFTAHEAPTPCLRMTPETNCDSQPVLHHINEKLSGIAHSQAQGLAWCGELGWHGGKFPAWRGARCSCRQMLRLGWQPRRAVDEAGAIC